MPTKKEKSNALVVCIASNWLSNWPIRSRRPHGIVSHAFGVERKVWCCWEDAQAKRIHQKCLIFGASEKPWIATGVKGVVWWFLRESVCCLMGLNPNRQSVALRGLLAVCFMNRLRSVVYSVINEGSMLLLLWFFHLFRYWLPRCLGCRRLKD